MTNLWQGSKKSLYKELYMQYLEEGYTSSEAKKLAKEEVADMIDTDTEFINEIIKQEYDDG
jgi:hypothetical protein|tara:strand:+ start:152 stop:334 length:183 start_codon:yes stop_codon:yes gene_type:complete